MLGHVFAAKSSCHQGHSNSGFAAFESAENTCRARSQHKQDQHHIIHNRFLSANASSLVAYQFHEIGISSNSSAHFLTFSLHRNSVDIAGGPSQSFSSSARLRRLLPSPAPLLRVRSQSLSEEAHSTLRIYLLASGTEICSEGRNAMTVRHVCLQTGDGIHVQVREDLAKKLQSKAYM